MIPSLTAVAVLAQVSLLGQISPDGPIFGPKPGRASTSSTPDAGAPVPLFLFAPVGVDNVADSYGLGGTNSACACNDVQAVDGGALTFTRASTGYCTKTAGSEVTGIANGDLVECAINKPRIMSGNSPGLGIAMSRARTNSTIRSSEINDPFWDKGGGVTPTVTANDAVGPDGDVEADRVEFGATTSGQESVFYNLTTVCPVAGGVISGSFYLKGKTASGSISFFLGSASACGNGTLIGTYCLVECSFNPTTWTRCINENVTNINNYLFVGNDSFLAGHTADRAAADVLVAKVQCEQGSTVSAPIDTTTVAVTRATEMGTIPWTKSSATPLSFAVTAVVRSRNTSGAAAMTLYTSSSQLQAMTLTAAGVATPSRCNFRVLNVDDTVDTAGNVTMSAANRLACHSDRNGASTIKASCVGGVCTTGTANGNAGGSTSVVLGSDGTGGSVFDGVLKNFCGHDNTTGCR